MVGFYKRLLFLLIAFLSFNGAFSQSPGGVSTNLKFWVKAGTNTTLAPDVSIWGDLSGTGNNAFQATTTRQPILVANDLNFNPTVNFSGSTSVLQLTTPPADLNSTIFAVGIPTINSNWRTMFRGTAGHHPIIVQSGGTGLGFYDNSGGAFKSGGFTWLQNEPAIVGLEMRAGDVNFRKNGSQGASITTIPLGGFNLDFFGNYQLNGQNFGKIAEAIIYNGVTPLTVTEKSQIESYLAVKYGLTLAHNYFASDGSTIWDIATNVGYNNNIAGIGADVISGLDQVKSISVNIAGASVTIDHVSSMADKNFLLWGDDAGIGSSGNVPPVGYTLRSNRTWKTTLTGPASTTVNFSVDLAAIGLLNTGNATDYSILIDSDNDFSSITSAHTSGASLAGNILSFTGVVLGNANYFAIGASNIAQPGGVAGLVFWVKGDAGVIVSPGPGVNPWKDQSGYNDAIQATPANQPLPVASDVNFNPTVNFGTGTSYMSITNAPADLNTTVFTVGVPFVNANWRTMFRGTALHHPLIIQSGGTALGFYDNASGGFKASGFTWLQNETALVSLEMRTGDVNFRKNGTQGGSISTINLTGGFLNSFGNYTNNNQNFGRIAETIIYNTPAALTATQKSRIESYLAVKYGVSLTHDYLATDGSTFWNATTNASYLNNITSIGRDDATGLSQPKSRSVNAAAVITLEKTTPAAPFSTNLSFITAGDDGGTLGATIAGVPAGFPAFPMRVTRIWRAQLAGAPGTVNISFDLGTGIYTSATASNYSLLVANAADFSAVTPITGGTINSNVLTFSNVSLSDGNYFTLGLPLVTSPGGIVNGLRVWLKGDLGVSSDAAGTTPAADLGTVQRWNDQTSLNNNAINTGNPVYNTSTNTINFNPTVYYDGTSGHNLTYSSINQYSLFTISKMEGSLNKRAFSSRIGNALLGFWNGREDVLHMDGTPSILGGSPASTNPKLYALTRASSGSGAYQFFRNGLNLSSGGTSFNSTFQLGIANGGNYPAEASKEYVSEVIQYDRDITPTELAKVQSYLAIKYGLTLNQSTPLDYVTSTGTAVWSGAANALYASDITIIGRDDASALDQRKSKSVNPGSVFTLEKNTPTNPFATNLGFLAAGDDAGSLGATTTGVPPAFPAFPMRVTRIWRAQMSGTPGTANISFDLGTGIYNSNIASNYSLLISSSSDFSASVPVTGASITSNVVTFTNVTLADGNFFTLGLPLVPSPGGVVSGLRIWLKANSGVSSDAAGLIPATDLGPVQRWNDQTSLSNNGTATGSPVFNTTTNLINFNPTVFYDGTTGHNLNYSGINQYSLITVSKMEGTLSRRLFASRIGNVLHGYYNGREDDLYLDGNPSILGGPIATTNPRLYSLTRASGGSGAYQFFRNGLSLSSGATSFNSTIQLGIANGGANPGQSSKAYVSEVIQYDRDLTLPELNRVQSYLAIKYGIAIDQTVATNYLSSTGTVIWDATANIGYPNDITGIGRDDASGLSQQKSKSVNAKTVVTLDEGGAFATDKSYLIVGSDVPILTPTQVNTHTGYPYRLGRTWRAQIQGAPGPVSVSFDLGVGIYNTGNPADYSILINSTPDFTGGIAYTAGASFNGSVITFTGVNFTSGDYFTLGMPLVPGPGGVVNNLQFWIKADQGVNGVGTASGWNDLSGNGFNVSQLVTGSQPAIQLNRLNSNPALVFNGSSSSMSLTGGILGTSTYTDANVFVISRANAIQTQSVFFETTVGGQFNGHIPWSNSNTYWDAGNTGTNRLNTAWGGFINTPYLWSMTASTSPMPSGALQDLYRNGQRFATDLTMNTFSGNNSNWFIGSGSGTNFFNGEISEIAVYTGPISGTQLQQIQSYLALKYGLTLNQNTPQDYLSTAGTPVFHATTSHSGFSKDIAGIGRDDQSGLDQRKSKSVNTPTDILSIANGDFTTPAAFGGDRQFLVWGDNGMPVSSDVTATSYVHNTNTIVRQILRVWSTDVTGAPTGNSIVEVDMNLVSGPTGLGTNNTADIRLLIDNDVTFGNGSAGEHAYAVTTVTAGKAYFTVPYAHLTPGQGYLTVGSVNATTAPLFTPTPGGIAADVRLWLRADVGFSSAGVVTWLDQSPNGFTASQGVGANQPSALSSRLNFNPAINFDGTNDDLSIVNGVFRNSIYSDVYVYSVARTNLVKQAKVFTENTVSGQFGLYHPWSDNNVYWDAGEATATNRLIVNWQGSVGVPYLWSVGASTNTTPSGVRQEINRNGLRLGNDATMNSFTGNFSNSTIGSQLGTNFFNGEISEFMIVSSALTTAQQQRIHSYFAIKYGLTLNQNAPQDYYSSVNSVIYHTSTTHSSFKNDIAGIARDDNSTLDQRKSMSSNTPADIFTMANGNFATPTAMGSDQQYLMWGNNGLPNASDAATVPFTHNLVLLQKRLARVWSTDKNGAPAGNVVIEYNMDLIGGPGGLGTNTNADVRLLIDGDPTFGNASPGELTQSPNGGFAVTGGKIYFTVPFGSIPNGQGYVTIGSINGTTCPLAISLPGGVAAPMKLWLKANQGVTGVGTASQWLDQSPNAFIANSGAGQPAIVANRINFNPTLQFNGANTNMSITNGILGINSYTDFTVFMIARTNTVTAAQSFFESTSGGQFAGYTPWSDNNIYWDAGNSAANRLNVNWGGTANTPYMWSLAASTTATASGASEDIYRNGFRIANDATMGPFTGSNSNFFIGSGNSANFYNGDIAEYIVYPASLTAPQQQRVQSYLGIKYGLTIDQSTATNYVSSSGSILWNATTNATYKFDIAGIGRDDASGLDQRKSQSINTRSIVQMDKGAAFGTDKDFVLWGSDNGSLAVTTVGAFPGFNYRVIRTWKAALSGTPGPVNIIFDLSQGIYNSGTAANYQLMVKTGDINFGAGATGYSGTLAGNLLTFSGVPLSDGQFFSLGLNSFPAPGGVVPNMQLWVKANAGVTASPNVSLWADQSGSGDNAVQNSAGAQPAFLTSDINYNPSVNFSNGSSIMSLAIPPANLNSTIFTIGVPIVNTNWRTMFRGAVNDHPLIIQQSGTLLGYYDGDNVGFKSSGFAWLTNEIATVALEMRAGNVNFRKNGTQGATIATINLAGLNLDFFGNYQGNNQNFGRIPETVIYNNAVALTATEKSRIESYFAMKYGLTLTHDYLASDASVLWNVTTNATYTHDMAAIGRDDNSALSQKQSGSVNNGNILAIGNGTGPLAVDNASNTNTFTVADKSFMLWGHNNLPLAGLGVTDFGTTTNAEVIKTRLARVWLSQEVGTVTTVHLRFDLSNVKGVGGVTGANDLSKTRLLVDGDGVFATGALSISPTTFNSGTGIVEFETDFIPATGFYFTIGSTDLTSAPLPVELVSFDAVANEEDVTLSWVTASEHNNDYFVVQSSIGDEVWSQVDTVKGKGTTSERSAYETRDTKPFIGKSYYRLMQVDFDGTKKFSPIRMVEYMGSLKLYPNPTASRKAVTLEIPSLNSTMVITVTNILGQDVYTKVLTGLTLNKKQVFVLDLGDLRVGEYIVRVFDGTTAHYKKLVVE